MNCLAGIQIINDQAAARGHTLTYDRRTRRLKRAGVPIGPVFTSRAQANTWARRHGATVSVV